MEPTRIRALEAHGQQINNTPLQSSENDQNEDIAMKTVLITGATDGIGRETARQLLEKGWHVLLHGRTREKAERVAQELSGAHSHGQGEPVWGELSRMGEVVQLAERVKGATKSLDVLINNAGGFEAKRRVTTDGIEQTMAVNHFATFLLTHHLLGLLGQASAGRVVTVSSIAHQNASLDVSDLALKRGQHGYDAYCTSKLANVLFTRALAKRLTGTTITANCLHPGVVTTKLLWAGFRMKGSPVERGARTSVYLATSDDVVNTSGKYFVDCREAVPSAAAQDDKLAEALWQASELLLAKYL